MRGFAVLVLLVSCVACTQTNNHELSGGETKADTISNHDTTITKALYTAFYINEKGNIADSFATIQHPWQFIHTNTKQPFPNGLAAYQQTLTDTLLNGCEKEFDYCAKLIVKEKPTDTFYCEKRLPFVEQFKPTPGISFFNASNRNNYYVFLTQIDSTQLYTRDSHNGILSFMRLKTNRQKLEYAVKQTKYEYVNQCHVEEITWKQKVPVYLLEDNNCYNTWFTTWYEAWECGQKADYAPKYPWLNVQPVKGLKRVYASNQHEDTYQWINNPFYVFSYMVMNEEHNVLKTVSTKSYAMQLVTTGGKIVKGTGIDLNGDKHADAFWFNTLYESGPMFIERCTLLYIKNGEHWEPVYSLFFNEFGG